MFSIFDYFNISSNPKSYGNISEEQMEEYKMLSSLSITDICKLRDIYKKGLLFLACYFFDSDRLILSNNRNRGNEQREFLHDSMYDNDCTHSPTQHTILLSLSICITMNTRVFVYIHLTQHNIQPKVFK